jgi:hypothetical protein
MNILKQLLIALVFLFTLFPKSATATSLSASVTVGEFGTVNCSNSQSASSDTSVSLSVGLGSCAPLVGPSLSVGLQPLSGFISGSGCDPVFNATATEAPNCGAFVSVEAFFLITALNLGTGQYVNGDPITFTFGTFTDSGTGVCSSAGFNGGFLAGVIIPGGHFCNNNSPTTLIAGHIYGFQYSFFGNLQQNGSAMYSLGISGGVTDPNASGPLLGLAELIPTPEPTSLFLLTPGLLPTLIGLALKRRS